MCEVMSVTWDRIPGCLSFGGQRLKNGRNPGTRLAQNIYPVVRHYAHVHIHVHVPGWVVLSSDHSLQKLVLTTCVNYRYKQQDSQLCHGNNSSLMTQMTHCKERSGHTGAMLVA